MWNPFAKRRKNRASGPVVDPNATIRAEDLQHLIEWAATRPLVQGYVEPVTWVNEMSVVLVDLTGEWTRRRIGGPKGAREVHDALGIPLYDVLETGYPEAMRERIEAERIERKRAEHRQRRAQREREERRRSGRDS